MVDLSSNPVLEEEIKRCQFFKNDFDKGEGWEIIHKEENNSFWRKAFPSSSVPVKILFTYDLPIPAKIFCEMLDVKNVKTRKQWDTVFNKLEILETLHDVGYIGHLIVPFPWPIADRDFVFLVNGAREIDWYGQKAYLLAQRDYAESSQQPNKKGRVRGHNGGDFYVVTSSDDDKSCHLFALTSNNYDFNSMNQRLLGNVLSKTVSETFRNFLKCAVVGYEKYFKNEA